MDSGQGEIWPDTQRGLRFSDKRISGNSSIYRSPKNSTDAIRVLLEAKAATLMPARDSLGMTAREAAEKMGHKEASEAIRQYD